MTPPLTASKNCLDIIKEFEGFSARPYICPAGVPTIGYGNTRYPDGRKVTMQDRAITVVQAEQILEAVLNTEFAPGVRKVVTVAVNQNQFDALVDFAYNCGVANLRSSTLLRKLNAGDYLGAADEFAKWNKGGGKVLPGLVRRRAVERALFVRGV